MSPLKTEKARLQAHQYETTKWDYTIMIILVEFCMIKIIMLSYTKGNSLKINF